MQKLSLSSSYAVNYLCIHEIAQYMQKAKAKPWIWSFMLNCEVHEDYCYIYNLAQLWLLNIIRIIPFSSFVMCHYFSTPHKKSWINTNFWNILSTNFQGNKWFFLVIYFYLVSLQNSVCLILKRKTHKIVHHICKWYSGKYVKKFYISVFWSISWSLVFTYKKDLWIIL